MPRVAEAVAAVEGRVVKLKQINWSRSGFEKIPTFAFYAFFRSE